MMYSQLQIFQVASLLMEQIFRFHLVEMWKYVVFIRCFQLDLLSMSAAIPPELNQMDLKVSLYLCVTAL